MARNFFLVRFLYHPWNRVRNTGNDKDISGRNPDAGYIRDNTGRFLEIYGPITDTVNPGLDPTAALMDPTGLILDNTDWCHYVCFCRFHALKG